MLEGNFDRALTDECTHRAALGAIADVSLQKIYRARHVTEIEAAGFEILPGLMGMFTAAAETRGESTSGRQHQLAWRLLPPEVQTAVISAGDDTYAMLRAVVNYVSGLTDRHAVAMHRKLKGMAE